jgi:DNA-binding transcriptional LysR family regulator
MNWDDTRLFLALARSGSARATATEQGVSHSTVTRRVDHLESALGVRLFDRDVRGYRLTGAGEVMMKSAVRAEDALLTAERQLQGRDAQLTGEIRLTTSNIIATHLIMDDLVEFTRQYPDIDLNVLISYDLFNLSRREADVAIRILRLGSSPPEDLVGRRLVTIKNCYYASEAYLAENDPRSVNSTARWIGWDDSERFPAWVKASPFPNLPVYGRLNDVMLQAEAARCGMGLTVLPCFFGDSVEGLRRIPNCEPYLSFDLWMLSHPDLRDAARMRTFRAFAAEVIDRKKSLLEGESALQHA